MLPHAEEAIGVQDKLVGYSLNESHGRGGPKARGFALILGITVESIDYLSAAIYTGIRQHPIKAVATKKPYGFHCVVEIPLHGVGSYSHRVATLRTVWELGGPLRPPRLISAFPRPR